MITSGIFIGIGLIFGYWPARPEPQKLNPIKVAPLPVNGGTKMTPSVNELCIREKPASENSLLLVGFLAWRKPHKVQWFVPSDRSSESEHLMSHEILAIT